MTGPGLDRAIWAIALPAMLTNLATALFGLADMWAIGQLGAAAPQAGVELGAKLMAGLLVVFNFVRMGTTALTAQAAGRGDAEGQAAVLARALAVALAIGAGLLLLWPLAVPLGLRWLGAAGAVADEARAYTHLRYPGGLLWLVNAALTGWLIGRRRLRAVLAVEVAANLIHIALDLALVLGAGWGVVGVAAATLASEAGKTLALGGLVAREPPARRLPALIRRRETWRRPALLALLAMNRDLFLRTLILMAAILVLARLGAAQGAATLAANGILYQLFLLTALLLDGFESAGQVLGGEAAGAGDAPRFRRLAARALAWAALAALALAGVFALAGRPIVAAFSRDPAVVAAAVAQAGWAAAIPLAGVASFVLDGLFIGAGWTRAMLATMAAAFAAYAVTLWLAQPLANHGLWLAFTLFLMVRGVGQALWLPRLIRRLG